MEILIVGVIAVALMIYTSTKIKKNAAAAFAEEKIETDEFSLLKPEGFLNPVENKDYLAFYAYSREYGEEDAAEKVRQSLIKLKVTAGRTLTAIGKEIEKSFDQTFSEEKDGADTHLLKGSRTEKEAETVYYHKIVAGNEKIYDLEISILAEYDEKFAERAEKLLESFRVK